MTELIKNQTQQKAVTAAGKPKTMQDYIKAMEPAIKAALPSVITPERFTRITLSALSTNAQLCECTPKSFLGAMMTAAQLGLEPNTPLGQAYLIPYNNNKARCKECQFQIGYKGLIDLAYRSGEVSVIQAHVVHENDKFEYSLGLEPTLEHVPAMKDRGDPIAYYAMYRKKDGGFGFEVMSIDDVREHAKKYSKAFGYGPWQTNFDEMAKKTVLKKLLKYAPMKTDFVRAAAQDESVKTELSDDMYEVPNTFVEADYEVDETTGEVTEIPDPARQSL